MKKRNGINIKYFKPQDYIAYYTHIETDDGTTVSSGIVLIKVSHLTAVQVKSIRNTIEAAQKTLNEKADENGNDLYTIFTETFDEIDFLKNKHRVVPLVEEIEDLPITILRKMITGTSRQLLHTLNQVLDFQ